MEEEKRTEVIHSIKYAEEETFDQSEQESETKLEGIDLDDTRAIADYYMAKHNLIDSNQLEVEKKEKELIEDIKEVVENKESLIEYLTNLHASIEVMEERIYELELKLDKKEKQSLVPRRPPIPGLSGKGLSQLPFNII